MRRLYAARGGFELWTGSAVAAVIQVCVLGLLSIQHVNDKQDSNAADGVFLCSGCLATLVVRLYINLTPTARLNFLFSSPIDSIIHSLIHFTVRRRAGRSYQGSASRVLQDVPQAAKIVRCLRPTNYGKKGR